MSLGIFLCALLELATAFEPAHVKEIAPVQGTLNVIASTWVIVDLDIGIDGRAHFPTVLKGEEPLRSSVLSSVNGWTFSPAQTTTPVQSHITGIFLFRARDIFSAPPLDLSDISVRSPDSPPIPVGLSDPGYMVNSVAEGEVVLELRLSAAGDIQSVRVVKGIPGLTQFTVRAVRSWRFAPALLNGQPVPGTVIVVISYLRPVVG